METYILIPWSEVQEFMEEQWFYDEAILAVGAEDKVVTSAYFIPERRVVFEENQQKARTYPQIPVNLLVQGWG